MSEKHVIWSNIDINLDDWQDFLEEEYPDVQDLDDQYELVERMNDEYLEDERVNLDVDVGGRIVIFADLGLWYGRRGAYRLLKSSNISDVLVFERDIVYAEWYVEDGELCGRGIHHDGTNLYTYRALRDDLTDEEYESVIYGEVDTEEAMKLTKPLGEYVAKVYGFAA